MEKKKVKLALCMIIKPTDKEAELMARALNSIARDVDGIFITITGYNEKVEKTAKLYGAHISHFDWVHDFAAARNFNFKQVPKDYTHIVWQDADDMIRGSEKLKPTIEKNPDVDGFIMNYLYWFDENKNPTIVHLKTMVVRNDNSVEWAGELHEDFKMNRELNLKLVKGIDRLHLSDEARANENSARNMEIAKKQASKHPNDPRVFWNLANAYHAVKQNAKALESFDRFLAMSKSDEEKYISLVKMGEIYMTEKQYNKALETTKMAIGTKPEYPDAYYLRGNIQFSMQNFTDARDSYILGMKQKPPVYQIIVFNPREYDYAPLKNLAKIYFNMGQPTLALTALKAALKIMPGDKEAENIIKIISKEAGAMDKAAKAVEKLEKIKDIEMLRKAMDELPDDVKSHPIICSIRNRNFLKTSSSGKDLVFYCGPTNEEWNPQSAKEKGIGGSEEAVINLSTYLVTQGWNVTVYNSCGFKEQVYDGVKWKPFWMWNPRDKQDVTVLWRNLKPLDYPINSTKIYVDVHDVMTPGEFTEQRLAKLTKILVKSHAHRELFPDVPDSKFTIIPNGVDLSLFENPSARRPYYIVNFSSPDRSLSAAMDIFLEARKRVSKDIQKQMEFGWFYGWQVFESIRTSPQEYDWSEKVKKQFEQMKKEGLARGGDRISHRDVADQNMMAGVLLYPSEFYEIDWVGGSKTQIAGCIPITAGFAAQKEKVKYGLIIPSKKTIANWGEIEGCDFSVQDPEQKEMFVNALVDYLENPDKFNKDRKDMEKWARQTFDIKNVGQQWHEEFKK